MTRNLMGVIVRWIVLSVLLVSLLAGCGGDSGDDGAAAARDAAAAQASEKAADEAAREAEEAEAERVARQAQRRRYRACASSVAGLSDAVSEINSRLSVGLTNDEYGDYVGDAQVEYDDLIDLAESGAMTGPCLRKVATPLESALNDHITVYNDWADCINSYPCDFNEGQINDDAQNAWVRAADRTDSSGQALAAMRP